MANYIIFSRKIDLSEAKLGADRGENPRQVMGLVADALDACLHWPDGERVTLFDKGLAKIFGSSPELWALAKRMQRELKRGDVVYCMGEDVGIPIAARCGGTGKIKVAAMFHNIDRPRARLAFKLLGLRSRFDLCFAIAKPQADFLLHKAGLAADAVHVIDDNTDTDFFSPGPVTPDKLRPLVISVGLEQRDYRTLAAATEDLDIDVRISGFSRDASALAKAFPAKLPANMDQRFYEWPKLLQLYRDADVVVVTMAPNIYAAGVQGVMEGMAVARPVIASRTEGMASYLATVPVTTFESGDAKELRSLILAALDNPEQGQKGRAVAVARHAQGLYVDAITQGMRKLAGGEL